MKPHIKLLPKRKMWLSYFKATLGAKNPYPFHVGYGLTPVEAYISLYEQLRGI